ncbi:MAG TPA: DASS family sodium-coupled anion symporter [Myxococcota bacterium]|nr:DASS family sodium-coupled anion symporter [Myxococcota bacterium]
MAEVRRKRGRAQRLGLPAGPLLGLALGLLLPEAYAGPDGASVAFGFAGRATAGVAAWMATWWLTETIPLYATALLPLVLFPLLGVLPMKATAAPYAHPLIFLFLGGFLIAITVERWGLHRRLALVALRMVGERPTRMVGGFMLVTAGLSMWISNSAAAILMLPVATSVIGLVASRVDTDGDERSRPFALALLLGVAYSASIGGIATPIGTPPNLFLLSYAEEHLGRSISFVRWMGVGMGVVVTLLPLAWWLLTRVLFPPGIERVEGGAAAVRQALAALGPMGRGERTTLAVCAVTALLWLTRPLLGAIEVAGVRPLGGLEDAGIAMLGALALFVLPVDRRAGVFALDWEHAATVPWGVLLLFGGGLSLASAMQANGVGPLLGSQVGALAGWPSWVLVLAVVTAIVFLTELTSNTATAATLVPILAGVAPGLGLDPLLLAVPAAIAASCAFMLPAATPPNAAIFGSGLVTIRDMSRAGFWLNWIGIAVVTGVTYAVAMPLLAAD